ncbi:hypothetical protein CJ483_03235 [Bacillus sp. PK3_68]|nr:hypothetical protein CJ483_03235 [Bacillus sp. PK3_68]
MRSKYGSRKAVVDGITFDSKAEAKYCEHLKRLQTNDQMLLTYSPDHEGVFTNGRVSGLCEREKEDGGSRQRRH